MSEKSQTDVYKSIVVAGGKGMLASAILALLQGRDLRVLSVDYDTCDITDSNAVKTLFADARPTLLINCAAHTRVDACETEEDKANAINGDAVGHLASCAKQYGTKLIHFSTDFVFDGASRRPYRPDDAPNPISAYGRSKLLGERTLQEHNPPGWIIARTAWLYGPRGASFPRAIIERARSGQPLQVVTDQVGSPTYTGDLAAAVLELVDHRAQGIWHLTNAGQTSWHEFAKATLEQFGLNNEVGAITAADWKRLRPASANRPAYSVMDISAFEKLTGHPMPLWQSGLVRFRDAVVEAGGF